MDKTFIKAVQDKTQAESFECGFYGKVINKYRIVFCKESKEFDCQLKNGIEWLCLHN